MKMSCERVNLKSRSLNSNSRAAWNHNTDQSVMSAEEVRRLEREVAALRQIIHAVAPRGRRNGRRSRVPL